jgi:predicted ATPase
MSKKIFIVEGVWHVGKTMLVNKIQNSTDITVFSEPSHLTAGIVDKQETRDEWYAQAHLDNFKRAVKENGNGIIFIDRSIISSIAFRNAYIKTENAIVNNLYTIFKKELKSSQSKGTVVYVVFIGMFDEKRTLTYLTNHAFLKHFDHNSCLALYQYCIGREIDELVNQNLVNRLNNPTCADMLTILTHA